MRPMEVEDMVELTVPAGRVAVLEPGEVGGDVFVYDSPAPEFRLYRASLGPGETLLPGAGGARIVLCTDGAGFLRAGQATLKVARGESCFIPASDGQVTASGPADLFIAGNGISAG